MGGKESLMVWGFFGGGREKCRRHFGGCRDEGMCVLPKCMLGMEKVLQIKRSMHKIQQPMLASWGKCIVDCAVSLYFLQ